MPGKVRKRLPRRRTPAEIRKRKLPDLTVATSATTKETSRVRPRAAESRRNAAVRRPPVGQRLSALLLTSLLLSRLSRLLDLAVSFFESRRVSFALAVAFEPFRASFARLSVFLATGFLLDAPRLWAETPAVRPKMIRIDAKNPRERRVAGHINFMFYLSKYGFLVMLEESRSTLTCG